MSATVPGTPPIRTVTERDWFTRGPGAISPESEKPPEPEGPSGFSTRKLASSVLAFKPTAPSERLRSAVPPSGMEGAERGYASCMRIVREEPDDDLRAEVGQSIVLLGLVAVIVVIGLMMGLAF
jgi:hypothetical protein